MEKEKKKMQKALETHEKREKRNEKELKKLQDDLRTARASAERAELERVKAESRLSGAGGGGESLFQVGRSLGENIPKDHRFIVIFFIRIFRTC